MDNNNSIIAQALGSISVYQSAIVSNSSSQASQVIGDSSAVSPKTDIVSISKAARALASSARTITRQDAENFFQVAQHLESSSLTHFISMLSTLDAESQSSLLDIFTEYGDDIEDTVKIYQDLALVDRQTFIEAVQGAGAELSNFLQSFTVMSGEEKHIFLEIAGSLEKDQLQTFIRATGAAGKELNSFLATAAELKGDKLVNFIQAAANNRDDLDFLIQRVGETETQELADFLQAAAKSGKKIKKLDYLFQELPGAQRQILYDFANTLENSQFENLVIAATDEQAQMDELFRLTDHYRGEQRSAFLLAAARSGPDLDRFLRQSKSLVNDPELAESLFQATTKAGNERDTLFALLSSGGSLRQKILTLGQDLAAPDWQNFLGASRLGGARSSELVNITLGLAGRERSHFLFGAIQAAGQQEEYFHLSRELEGQAQEDFFYEVANGTPQEIGTLLDEFAGEETGWSQPSAHRLSDDMFPLKAEEEALAGEYVYLTKYLNESEFDHFLRAAMNADSEESVARLLNQAGEAENRQEFLELGAKAGKELDTFLNLPDELEQRRYAETLELGRQLSEKQFQQFLHASSRAGEKRDVLFRLSKRLTGSDREHFLGAAQDAATSSSYMLKKFLDLTGQFGDVNRSKFLSFAADAGGLLPRFLDASSQVIEEQRTRFIDAVSKGGFSLSSLLKMGYQGNAILSGTDPNAISGFVTGMLSVSGTDKADDLLSYYLTR